MGGPECPVAGVQHDMALFTLRVAARTGRLATRSQLFTASRVCTTTLRSVHSSPPSQGNLTTLASPHS
jgi:hypothetical protein